MNVVSLQKTKVKNFCTNPPTDGECGIPAEDEGEDEELLYQSDSDTDGVDGMDDDDSEGGKNMEFD